MTALNGPRRINETDGVYSDVPVKAGVTIFQGAIVAMENNLAVPGKTATGLTVLGFARETIDNTNGADGEVNVPVKRGTISLANLATDLIASGSEGQDCYLVDDQTVAATSDTNTRSVAGTIIQVENGGVFVRLGS